MIDSLVYKVVEKTDKASFDEIYKLRFEVWSELDGYNEHLKNGKWEDEFDAGSDQFIVLSNNRIVACARLTIATKLKDLPFGKVYSNILPNLQGETAALSRLVVTKEFRKRNIANTLDAVRIKKAREKGIKVMLALTSNSSRRADLIRKEFSQISSLNSCQTAADVWATAYLKLL